jgi:hypothetical protein
MRNSRRFFLIVSLVLTLMPVLGCAGTENREFARELAPMVGRADKAYFIEKYGEPDKRSALDAQTDVWEYSFGQENLIDYGARGNLSTSTTLRLTFKDGKFSGWQAVNRMK